MGRYKFRKMYFVCENKQVIKDNVGMTQAYREKGTADSVCATRNRNQGEEHKLWNDKTKPVPFHTVEEFYLVPAALYDKVLKSWCDGEV